MNRKQIQAEVLLLLAALFWGLAFVPQKIAMADIEPLAFNAWRFFLGGLILVPLVYWLSSRRDVQPGEEGGTHVEHSWRRCLKGGAVLGFWLFLGAALQQASLLYTSAGRAGFITGFYLLLVPVIGLSLGHKTNRWTWVGIALALLGLYWLADFSAQAQLIGDLMVFASAFVFAIQVLSADYLVHRYDALRLAAIQFLVCGALSAVASLIVEQPSVQSAVDAAWPIAYMMIFSTAIAFTFQLLAQRHAAPSHATVIMSLEAVFAVVAGWLFLNEVLSSRELMGCGLMLTGMLVSHYGNHTGTHH
ncbi:DMT family transporter [Microbulbifer hydrolyticus]|uniref:Drug/metabolite transporter (DMT)-like permease n=1 Tax=Microbulbifer hydrolyticus TaxID=48074 RepID=A0A6P1T9P4_9GAMM|nr:DMT family transporter [Microbulbifer hydrolyticus]MBB5209964.1 drug/metabolite transporter (DMT)-like permease [Microbulbifer hydrolyticus]QHQ39504.1 EamA family transporter [Microbulbifer hydrolyticus]